MNTEAERTFRTLGGYYRTWSTTAYDGALALLRTLTTIPAEERMDALALAVMAGLPLTRSGDPFGVQFMLDDIERNERGHPPAGLPESGEETDGLG